MNSLHQILDQRFAAVVRVEHVRGELPYPLVIVWINADLAVVHRTRIDVAQLAPGLAAIIGAKCSALGIFNQRINDVWIAAINVQTDASRYSFGQSLRQLVPGGAAVDSLIEGAARPATIKSPGRSSPLVSGGVESHWTCRVHCQINHAGVFVDEEDIVPGFAAVSRLEYAAFF